MEKSQVKKMAIGHYLDGLVTCVIGTHTHVPTADTSFRQRNCLSNRHGVNHGDYNSVIGMNKKIQ